MARDAEKKVWLPTSMPVGTEGGAGIEAISLDMWPAFINAFRDGVPQAYDKMVFDRFHIMHHVVEGVDKVRKQDHKTLMDKGDTTLVKSNYLWLTSLSNMTDQAKTRFKELQSSELKTGRAWAIKEVRRELWSYTSSAWGPQFWKRQYYWVTHSRLQPMIEAAKLIAWHLPNVLTYFKHRITNAVAEGLNSKITTLQR